MAYTLGLQVITTLACNYCLIIIVTTWFKHKIITNTVKYVVQTGKKALKIWNAYKYIFRRAVKQLFYYFFITIFITFLYYYFFYFYIIAITIAIYTLLLFTYFT